MADLVNLRQARKTRARMKKRAEGDENAAKFGQTRAEKSGLRARAEKARATLDAHKRDKE